MNSKGPANAGPFFLMSYSRSETMTKPTEEDIRAKAYQLWKEAGEPEGQAESLWHKAQEELGRESADPGELPPGTTDNCQSERLRGDTEGMVPLTKQAAPALRRMLN